MTPKLEEAMRAAIEERTGLKVEVRSDGTRFAAALRRDGDRVQAFGDTEEQALNRLAALVLETEHIPAWTCGTCDYTNPPEAERCDGCGRGRGG